MDRKTTEWWQDFENGILLYEQHNADSTNDAIKSIRGAFNKGLNVQTDRSNYFKAAKILSMLYFEQGKYRQVITQLTNVINNGTSEEIPDWVWSYYALSMFNARPDFVVDDPLEFFFKYTDKVHDENEGEIQRRACVCKEMFEGLVSGYSASDDIDEVKARIIIDKACEYQLNNTTELHEFKDTFLPTYTIPVIEDVILEEEGRPIETTVKPVEQDHIQTRAIEQLKAEIAKMDNVIIELNKRNSDLSNENTALKHQIKTQEQKLTDVIKTKELYHTALVDIDNKNAEIAKLNSQLESAQVRIQKEKDHAANALEEANKAIKEKHEANRNADEYVGLYALMERERNNAYEERDKAFAERDKTIVERDEAVAQKEQLRSEYATYKANAEANSKTIYDSFAQSSSLKANTTCNNVIFKGHCAICQAFNGQKKKIAVISDERTAKPDLLNWAIEKAYKEEDFGKICTNYSSIKHGGFPELGESVFAVIVGSHAHDVNSDIASLQRKYGEEYVIKTRVNSRGGELKLTKQSFQQALSSIETKLNARFA